MGKDIYYKLFENDGTFVDTFFDFVAGSFSAAINAGYGNLELQIPREFDFVFSNINFDGYIERWVSDIDNNAVLTYTGYIDKRSSIVGQDETSKISLSGYWAKLAKDIVVTGSDVTVTYTATDTAVIMRDLINNKFKTNNTTTKIATATTVEIPNTTINRGKTFSMQNYQEALLEMKDLSGANYYLFLDNDNRIYLRTINTTSEPTHYFQMGRDILSANYQESTVEQVNGVYFWNGVPTGSTRIMKRYTVSDSIATYGRSFVGKKDSRYTTTASSDSWASRYLESYKNPLVTLQIRLFDNNFSGEGGSIVDIESIKPGDTFKILNIDGDAPFADTIYYITQTTDIDGMFLDITSVDPRMFVSRQLQELNQRQLQIEWGYTASQPFTT